MSQEMNQEMPSFDTLLDIAKNDPEQLEQLRHQLASKTIDGAPDPLRQRLRGLQFQIDSTRLLAKTPLAACIRISEMMHNSMEELRLTLNQPTLAVQTATSHPSHFEAKILPFTRR